MEHNHVLWLKEAIRLAEENVYNGGGPFACLIVKDGSVVGKGVNRVVVNCDPTAHAEVQAIREACAVLQSHQLDGCVVYTSCEPCPMCLGAIYWARPQQVFFAALKEDAAAVGFDDSFIYTQISLSPEKRSISFTCIDATEKNNPFHLWADKEDRVDY